MVGIGSGRVLGVVVLLLLTPAAEATRFAEPRVGRWHEAMPPYMVPRAGTTNGLVEDEGRSRLLTYQGPLSETDRGATWSLVGNRWGLEGRGGPSASSGVALGYDENRRRMVLFGGVDHRHADPETLGETWEWNGRRWRQRPIEGPSPRSGAAMAYDSARQTLILHGSESGDRETWAYGAEGWTLLSGSGPAVASPAMAYDVDRQRSVLFGGTTTGTTWVWNGSRWREVPAPGPSARTGHAMAYDPIIRRIVLSGGADANGRALKDVWELDGDVWRRAGTLPARTGHGMAYDASAARLVVFGGYSGNAGRVLRDTLVRRGERWANSVPRKQRQPPSGTLGEMVYDSVRGEAVMIDSEARTTWTWDGSRWWQQAGGKRPSSRIAAAIAYDPDRGRVVLFGGVAGDAHADTWEWDGRRWRKFKAAGPVPAYAVAMAYDPRQSTVVMFGGGGATGTVELDQFWQWDGSRWREIVTATVPEVRAQAAMAFDALRGQLLMTGGYSVPLDETPDMQTWDFDGANWNLLTTGGPGNRASHALAVDPVSGKVLLFGGFETQTSDYGQLGDLWSWDGAGWSEIEIPKGSPRPFPDDNPALVYDEVRDEFVMFGGNERNGTWIYKPER